MDVKAKSVTGFYDDEAARIVSRAAQGSRAAPASPEKPAAAAPYVPPVQLDEPQRPLLAPEAPTNQNLRSSTQATPPARPRRRTNPVRVLAWILLSPWYAVIAAASVALIVLFVKDLLGF